MAKRELALECDYRYELQSQQRFRELVGGDAWAALHFRVPAPVPELSAERVLASEWVPGVHIDKVGGGGGGGCLMGRSAVGRLVPRRLQGLTAPSRRRPEPAPPPQVADMSQEVRDAVGTRLLRLTLKELFEWRFMQVGGPSCRCRGGAASAGGPGRWVQAGGIHRGGCPAPPADRPQLGQLSV